MKKLLRIALVPGLILIFACHGAAQDRLSPEILWKFGRVGGEQVSPDGKQLVYGITWYDIAKNKGNRDLYLLPLTVPKSNKMNIIPPKEVQITSLEGSESGEMWRPDGKVIGFLSRKSGSTQLWEVNPDGTGLRQVTDVEGGIANFKYSPDGSKILFTRDVKLDKTVQDRYPDLPLADARIIDDLMYRHWDSWHDFAYSHVHYLSYEDGKVKGEPIDLMREQRFDSPLSPMGGAEQINWSPDGNTIAYTCKKLNGKEFALSTNSDIYLYDLGTDKSINMTDGMEGYDVNPVYSPDGSKIAWLSMERNGFESDRNRIFIYGVNTGIREELTAGFDQSAGHLSWSRDGGKLYFTSVQDATEQIYQVDLAAKKISRITEGVHNYSSVQDAGEFLIGTKVSMSGPAEIFRIFPKGQEEQITQINSALLQQVKMGKVEKRLIKTTDGKDMLTWVIYPPDFDPLKKYPTLLYCQGGPQSAVSQFFSYRWNFQLMAARGYIVVAPNRRGLPGFGQEWNDAISKDWGGQAMKDYLSAIDEMAKQPFVDKNRLGAVGASYGGYSVYYLAGIHEKRFKTFIAHCGLFNLESWYGATEELFFANWDIGGPYWKNPQPASYEKYSPHKLVGNWDTPILVIHGEKDFRVPVGEGMQAFSAAQVKGIPSRFLYFPEEGHWVVGPQNGILWHRVFFEWLDKYLMQ